VIVIFASRYDLSATSLVARWADQDASLLTCDDLSVAGWRHYLNPNESSVAVINGRTVPVEEIKGVLIRWPAVFEQELTGIIPADRSYIAREMMAFLVSWFSSLKCPVINDPTPVNLTGPAWRPEQWAWAAAKLGIPVRKTRRHVARSAEDATQDQTPARTTVTVVGTRCFGQVEEPLLAQARRLADAAGVIFVNVSFSGPEADSFFAGVDLLPNLSEEASDAVLELLLR
jgi:hypothetical protein